MKRTLKILSVLVTAVGIIVGLWSTFGHSPTPTTNSTAIDSGGGDIIVLDGSGHSIAIGDGNTFVNHPPGEPPREVTEKYIVRMEVDRYRTTSGRGWDYPLQQPDPFPCLESVSDPKEVFCLEPSARGWSCQNKWQCEVEMEGPAGDELIVRVFDHDDGSFGSGNDDPVGEAECIVGQSCRLENNQRGYNSGSVRVTRKPS